MIAIINADLIMRDHFINDAVLFIEDGKIAGYGEMWNTEIPEGCEIIDAEGEYVGPGLIDIHAHVGGIIPAWQDPIGAAQAHLDHGVTTYLPTSHGRFSTEQNVIMCNNVREAMATIWSNDNAECDLFANLFGLSYFAELCFDKDASKEKLVARFEACTGADYDAFYTMSFYHNSFGGENDDYSNYSNRFLGKHIFWQDILEGLYDTHLFAKKMSGHYAASAEKMKACKGGRWDYLYEFAYRVFDYMATKTLIAENLVPAYKSGDKETLAEIASTLLPALKEKTIALHKSQKDMWFSNRNMIGWCNMDVRYAGVAARCDTAKDLIEAYLDGKIPTIESLDEERLPKPIGGFSHYSAIATPNLKT